MMSASLLLEPDFVVSAAGAPQEGPVLVEGTHIVAVGPDAVGRAPDDVIRVPLRTKMLAPAFVNAHSHSVQRALRGRVEARSRDQPDDSFWSWRDKMYSDALRFSLDDIEAVATWCFTDMLRSGFSTVGEFHYLHHAPDGAPWPDDSLAAARRVVRAANKVGIRISLLNCAYERAGPGERATDGQRRFTFDDVDAFLAFTSEARKELVGRRVSHGFAIHSVRACSRAWIEAIGSAAAAAGLPLHVHACEQRRELEIAEAEHGMSPLALLHASGALTSKTAVVHATHLDRVDIQLLSSSGSSVVLCPSTERNLGDGLCPISELVDAGVPLAIGTDSHARIDVADELRSLEDHERLRTERRCVLAPPGGSFAAGVFSAGTTGGARSLGLAVPEIAAGHVADLVAIALPVEGRGPKEGFDAKTAVDAWLVGGSGGDVTDVFVDGERVLCDKVPARVTIADVEQRAVEVLAAYR